MTDTPGICERVLDTIAEAEGTDPVEFNRPLYDVIDPNALDALFRCDRFDGQVEFTYLNYDIIISSDGAVNLTPFDG